ncbi:MAG: hypothetical protein R6V41_04035, partial [Desulfobacteraceae bacterium]
TQMIIAQQWTVDFFAGAKRGLHVSHLKWLLKICRSDFEPSSIALPAYYIWLDDVDLPKTHRWRYF